MADHRRSVRPRPSRRKRWWGWFGLGAAVLGALWWDSARERRRRSRPQPAPEPERRSAGGRQRGDVPGGDGQVGPWTDQLSDGVSEEFVPGPAGVSLRVLDTGDDGSGNGPPVLFLHGLGGRSEQFAELLRGAGPRRLAVDLPGHGGSDPLPEQDWSVEVLAACGAAVLDALGVRRALVAGHALGAAAALHLAVSRSGRIAGLLLLDPAADPQRIPEAQRRELLDSFAADPAGELAWYYRQYLASARPGVEEAVLGELPRVEPEALAGGLRASLEWSPAAALDGWRGPLRVLLSPLQDDPASLHRLRELDAVRLPDCSHWLMMDRPEAVRRHLAEMASERRPPPGG